jgi:hypothetical protein
MAEDANRFIRKFSLSICLIVSLRGKAFETQVLSDVVLMDWPSDQQSACSPIFQGGERNQKEYKTHVTGRVTLGAVKAERTHPPELELELEAVASTV